MTLKKLLLEDNVTSSILRNQVKVKQSLLDTVLDGKTDGIFEEGFDRAKRQLAFLHPDIPLDDMDIQKVVIDDELTSPPLLNDFLIGD